MKFLPVLFLFYSIAFLLQREQGSAKYKAVYNLQYHPSTTTPETIENEDMLLYLGNNFSRFSSVGKHFTDSLINRRSKEGKSRKDLAELMTQIPRTEFNYYIYKGIPQEKITVTDQIFKDKFKYTEEKDLFNWKITPQTKEISGYTCQKATTNFAGRDYTAWFTQEIPISDGPYKFNGLPGLIIKVSDAKGHYVFELKQFKKLEEPLFVKIPGNDFIETSKAKLFQMIRDNKENPMQAVERSGIKINLSKGQIQDLRRSRMNKNNPIELELDQQ